MGKNKNTPKLITHHTVVSTASNSRGVAYLVTDDTVSFKEVTIYLANNGYTSWYRKKRIKSQDTGLVHWEFSVNFTTSTILTSHKTS